MHIIITVWGAAGAGSGIPSRFS